MCGCKGGGNSSFKRENQRVRANLQAPRSFNNAVVSQPLSHPLQQKLMPGIPTSAERQRIQRLHQNRINQAFGR